MSTIATTDTGDFAFQNGDIYLIAGLDEVIQTCEQSIKQSRGELPFAQQKGVSYFDNLFTGNRNLQLFRAQLREELLTVNDVFAVTSVEIKQVNDKIDYQVTIKTTFGEGRVSGLL